MANYYPLVAKAVAGLSKSTDEGRRALYERAREALTANLRGMNNPPLTEAEITRERMALEEAIRKVEAEAAELRGGAPTKVVQDPPPDRALKRARHHQDELSSTLALVQELRKRDPEFGKSIAEFIEAEIAVTVDPAEGTLLPHESESNEGGAGGSIQTAVRKVLND